MAGDALPDPREGATPENYRDHFNEVGMLQIHTHDRDDLVSSRTGRTPSL